MTVSLSTAATNGSGTVTSQGLGSGIDIASLVSSLVTSTIQPQQTLLQNSQTADQSTISALGSLSSTLSSLQSAVDAITTGGALTQVTTQSSNTAVFSATAASGAVAGSYQVQINTIAQANKLQSAAFGSASAAVGTGPYTFTAGGKSFSVTLDSSNDTLSGLADAINGASDNSGVAATIVNGTGGSYLLLSATQTGTANAVSVSSSSPISFNSVQSAADATGTIDGLAFDSASNIVSGVLSNVTLNLASAAPNSTQTLTVTADTSSAATAVQSFVTAYNAALSLITTDTAFTPGSTDSASGTAGPLLGDLTIESVSRQLQSIIGGSTGSTSNAYTLLSQIGVSIGSDGSLSVDSSTLNSALQANPTAVKGLFSGTNGLGTQLDTLLNTVVGAGGVISTKTTALQTELDSISTQLTDLTTKSTQLTAQYNAQFNAMDSIVAAYKNTSSLLTQLYAPRTTSSSGSGSS